MYNIVYNVTEYMYDIFVYILSKTCIRHSSRKCIKDPDPPQFFKELEGSPGRSFMGITDFLKVIL